jgi:hypothetical protein
LITNLRENKLSLLIVIPTRSRPAQCKRLIKSFEETDAQADLLFVTDGDDDSYEGFDWAGHENAVLSPRSSLSEKLNRSVMNLLDNYDYVGWFADDNVFVTHHWDDKLIDALDFIGSGWVYPNNGRRADVPESWVCTADVVRELGWFANPVLQHYYLDNSIAELGRRAALIRWVPEVVIEHKHYSVDATTEYDGLYKETESSYGARDAAAFQAWKASTQIAGDVSRLRRKFNPDVQWALGKV